MLLLNIRWWYFYSHWPAWWEKKNYSSVFIFLHHRRKDLLFFIMWWGPAFSKWKWFQHIRVRLPCRKMLRFLSYMMSSPGRLIYENMTLGASGNSCVPAPAGGQALLGGPRYSQGQEFQDKKLQVRTQQHFKKHQGIFFFFFFTSPLVFY